MPGRTPFAVTLGVDENAQVSGGLTGTRFRYHVELAGKPVAAARIKVTIGKTDGILFPIGRQRRMQTATARTLCPYDFTGLSAGIIR